jgi:phosphoglycolate phosphatase
MPALKAIILDFDDTLFMTEDVSFQMENATATRLGYAAMTRETHRANWGKPIAEAIAERIPGIDVQAFMKEFPFTLRHFVDARELDQLSAANLLALQTLKDQGFELYAVTSRHLVELTHLMDGTHDLSRYLESHHIFHRDNNNFLKPDPRVFDAVLRFAKLAPGECLYVGDSVTDCQAAKGAGMIFVACLESGLRDRHEFERLTPPPDGYIDTFAELPAWIKTAVPA